MRAAYVAAAIGRGAVALSFQLAPDHRPPRWPDPAHPQQFHLDVKVDDIEGEQERVVGLGASFVEDHVGPNGRGFRIFTDPAGHPFCLCVG